MNWVWSGIEVSVNLVEVGLYLTLINEKFPPKLQSFVPFLIALIVGAIGYYCITLFNITWIPDYFFGMCIVFLYALFARKGSVLLKIFWCFIGMALICATALIGISVGSLLPGVTMDIIFYEQSAARFQVMIFCKLLQTVVFFFLCSHKTARYFNSSQQIIIFIVLTASSLFTAILLFEFGIIDTAADASQLLLACASLVVLLINLVVLFLFDSLSKQAEKSLRMHAQLQQFDMLQSHYKEVRSIYDEMRGWRHDYHNHLQVIHGYLQFEEYDKLKLYLKEIENSIDDMEMVVNSGNVLIDAIVSSKLLLARNQNIKTSVNIHVPPVIHINDTDMCIILGNLLDNAIQACQRMVGLEENQFIEIEIKAIKGHLDILVRNSTNGIVRMVGNSFLSVKKDGNHGIGTRQINEITYKYEGYIRRRHENCVFETNIIFPMKQESVANLQPGSELDTISV